MIYEMIGPLDLNIDWWFAEWIVLKSVILNLSCWYTYVA